MTPTDPEGTTCFPKNRMMMPLVLAKIIYLMMKFGFLGVIDVIYDVIAKEKSKKISNFFILSPDPLGDRYP